MNRARLRNLLLMAWTLVVVTACGGGGGGGGGVASSGGTGGTGVSYGPVTGFGSVFVNGVEFDTTNSTVMLNGTPDPGTDPHRGLMVGMVVKVEGTFDSNGTTGTAASITYKDNLNGPVSNIDLSSMKITALGQDVIIDSHTVFSGTTLNALLAGNVIEVSGLPDKGGNIHATLVAWKAASFDPNSMELEVKGAIRNLDLVPGTFQINNLTVDYSLAALPPGGLVDGQYVEVRGVSFDLAGALIATSVAPDDNTLGVTDASVAQVQGFVTAVAPPNQFTLGVQLVQTTAFTAFEGGSAGDIAVGKRMQVDGSLVGGILIARKISFL